MRKLLFTLIASMLLVVPALAGDRMCAPIWNDVAGQTYVLDLGEQSLDVIFSESYTGPCPQGGVVIYDSATNDELLKCRYMSTGINTIYLDCGTGTDIDFMLIGDQLIYIDPNTLIMIKK